MVKLLTKALDMVDHLVQKRRTAIYITTTAITAFVFGE
jgi:hypothetical protein